jgi:putative hydrolase of the HAD superfamily
MIRNIVFDMGNVLLSYEPEKYVDKIIKDPAGADAVLRELFGGPEWPMLDAGTITEEETVRRVQSRIPRYAALVPRAMERWDDMLTPLPGMPEIVAELKAKGYPLYVLSNMSLRFSRIFQQREIFRYFDGYVFSAIEKIVKPDPAIYRLLLNRFHLNADECLFFDDLPQNVEGAERVGLHAHRFAGTRELALFLKETL